MFVNPPIRFGPAPPFAQPLRRDWPFPDPPRRRTRQIPRADPLAVRPDDGNDARPMRSGLPWIIWRALFFELARLTLLTTAVLVVVISFAAAIKPLADGKIDAGQAIFFMVLAMPPMLQYALPFSAGFGATLTYHRFASDNEALAAMTGGVSHRGLLVPAAVWGLLLAVVLLGMSNEVIPNFLRRMEQIIRRDMARLIVNAVENGQSVALDGHTFVHADRIERRGADRDIGASDRLLMEGVQAIRTDEQGAITFEATARRAAVWLFDGVPEEGWTHIVISLFGAVVGQQDEGLAESGELVLRYSAPGGFADDPKFYSYRDMQDLREEPERVPAVDRRRRALALMLARERALSRLTADLEAGATAPLTDADGQRVGVRAAQVARSGLTLELEDVELIWRLSGERARLQRAAGATVSIEGAGEEQPAAVNPAGAGPVAFSIELRSVETLEAVGQSGATRRERAVVGPLTPSGAEPAGYADLTIPQLESVAQQEAPRSVAVRGALDDMRERVREVERDILSRLHERAAMSAACPIMILAGALVALRMQGSRPLIVYAWSFFPALIALITIESGQSTTQRVGEFGLAILWAGVGGLGAFALFEFVQVRRH